MHILHLYCCIGVLLSLMLLMVYIYYCQFNLKGKQCLRFQRTRLFHFYGCSNMNLNIFHDIEIIQNVLNIYFAAVISLKAITVFCSCIQSFCFAFRLGKAWLVSHEHE